uniref:Uncharacterized protein n=1 Tax=Physcomitrium patens TaxID=3218 RepID=A0A2K1K6S4_PHYPA|nr:hypothetical protein PHYPA_011377 [Physcomitrium patens]
MSDRTYLEYCCGCALRTRVTTQSVQSTSACVSLSTRSLMLRRNSFMLPFGDNHVLNSRFRRSVLQNWLVETMSDCSIFHREWRSCSNFISVNKLRCKERVRITRVFCRLLFSSDDCLSAGGGSSLT